MHLIQLGLKLEPKLNFFFVVLGVLSVLLLEFEPHLSFIHPLFFERFTILLEDLHVLLDTLLVVSLLCELSLITKLHLLDLLFVCLRNL